jgi:pimeloyl-ACP methyl ester carboxylesterase
MLQALGHRVITPELPGHGWKARYPEGYFAEGQPDLAVQASTLEAITVQSAAAVVIEALSAARKGGRRVVLVSHSSSGAIAGQVAETAPELVDHLLYVAAIVPSKRRSAYEFATLPEYGSPTMDGLLVGDPSVIGAMRINPRSTDPAYRALLHRKFYGDLSSGAADAFVELLCPDQPISFLAEPVTVTPERWGSVPRTYLKTLNDRSIAPAVQDVIVADADEFAPKNPFQRLTIDSGHSPFASRPDALAGVIHSVGVSLGASLGARKPRGRWWNHEEAAWQES